MDSQHRSQPLVGLAELAEMLGLSKPGTIRRTQKADFPAPIARLASGPVWKTSDVRAYARERTTLYYERPGVEALAAEPDDPETLSLEEAARTLGTSVGVLRSVAAQSPGMPGNWKWTTGELLGIDRSDLGLYARALGRQLVEIA